MMLLDNLRKLYVGKTVNVTYCPKVFDDHSFLITDVSIYRYNDREFAYQLSGKGKEDVILLDADELLHIIFFGTYSETDKRFAPHTITIK